MMTQHNWEFYLATLFNNLLSNGFSTLKIRVITIKPLLFYEHNVLYGLDFVSFQFAVLIIYW